LSTNKLTIRDGHFIFVVVLNTQQRNVNVHIGYDNTRLVR
jgi:hypothetical protein